ncbi:MFS transporter [Martelella alba]|uniref:MFS transporter n=1 Tax=Martelella alba TaxID=2590451 RepID=A0A506UE56_9HYPH|nr:MFS transporter [Martelella alba]TPW31125.1 MFS transporter [Martelella alba]
MAILEEDAAALPTEAGQLGLMGWMLFDWAAQPFFTIIITFIFGPYFVTRLGSDPVAGQEIWAHAATIAGILLAVMAPLAGAISDRTGANKRWIGFLAIFQMASLAMLWVAAPGTGYFWPALMIVIATVAAELSVVFNDSMLPRLVPEEAVNRVSNIAWGVGYLGGMIPLVFFVLFMSADPKSGVTMIGLEPLFGLNPASGDAERLTGPLSALWYFIFLMPLFLFTPDPTRSLPLKTALKTGLADLRQTVSVLSKRRSTFRFLIARMLYMDGVNALLTLGPAFAAALFGWNVVEIGLFGILINLSALAGCFIAAALSRHLTARAMVLVSLMILVFATIGFVSMSKDGMLFGLFAMPSDTGALFDSGAEKICIGFALLIGLAFGPVQAASRAFLASTVPVSEAGRYFGLYSLTGRITSFLGTGAFAIVTGLTGSASAGMATIIIFLLGGLAIFLTVGRDGGRAPGR